MSAVMQGSPALGRDSTSISEDRAGRTGGTVHAFEHDRLRALDSYRILDTDAEPGFDALATSAAVLLDTPRAAITFVDAHRQWSKASFGPGLCQLPREWSICADVVASEHTIVVADLSAHPRYATNPATFGADPVRSYAGVPLIGRDGLPLGAFSVSDRRPRSFTERETGVLAGLAQAAVALLELRRNDLETGSVGAPLSPLNIDPVSPTVGEAFSAAEARRALQRGEFEVHFRPVISTPDIEPVVRTPDIEPVVSTPDIEPVVRTPAGRVTGVQAVACWNLPGYGLVAPRYIQPHLQASSLLWQSVTEFVLNTSCQRLASWHAMGARELRLSVEVSGHDLTGGRLPAMVAAAVERAGIGYAALTLLVIEMPTTRDRAVAGQQLNQLRDLGVRVTLQDRAADLLSCGATRAPLTTGHAGSPPVTAAHITELLRRNISCRPLLSSSAR